MLKSKTSGREFMDQMDDKLYNDQVSNIVKDREGRIWIGTFGGGFCRFDEEKGIMEWLTAVEGLSDDNINSIIPGDDGKLWISTGNGISAYDPESRQFTNYMGRSEIPVNEFSMKGGIKLPGDRIYFSGSNGLVSFYPERLIENRFIPPVVLTSFTVNNKPVVPGDPSGLLDKVLDYTQAIDLDYNQNNFSVGYAALNYLYPNQNKYAYMLEGYDTDWNDAGSRKEAFYTNLKPGDYVFRVRASNNDGLWNDEGRSLSIHIRTPFWQTWYAYMLYLLIIGGILYVVWYYLHMKRKLEQDLVEKQKEQQRQEEFHQSKIRMFTNFSHELRTPLTSVKSYLEALDEGALTESVAPSFVKVSLDETNRMMRMITDLLSLSRIDNQVGEMDVELINFTAFITFILNRFDQMKNSDVGKTYAIIRDYQISPIWVEIDTDKMTQVLDNILNNAIKYSPDGGNITFSMKTTDSQLILSISDEGLGIPKADLPKIFDRFYRVDKARSRAQGGTGLGLAIAKEIVKQHKGFIWAKSEYGHGSTFTIVLPYSKDIALDEWEEVAEEE
jgi:signal transduction histidine kinase